MLLQNKNKQRQLVLKQIQDSYKGCNNRFKKGKKHFLCVRELKGSLRNMAGHCKRLFWLTGLVLGAVALAAMNGLKAGTKAVGKGLKTIGQKLGSLLPGLIGSIVSFIFKSAGQVLSFLGEHAWLLILAVVAFFMERLLKKRRKQ